MAASFIKKCRNERAFLNELFVYKSDYPNKAELIEIREPHTLVLQRLGGIPYLDVPDLSDRMIIALAIAISKLHSLAKVDNLVLCHWDNQPKNILWDEQKQKIYLVDFEHIRMAPPETDLAHLFLFWAEVLDETHLSRLTQMFIDVYSKEQPIDCNYWNMAVQNAIKRFDRRRVRFGRTKYNPKTYKLLKWNNLAIR